MQNVKLRLTDATSQDKGRYLLRVMPHGQDSVKMCSGDDYEVVCLNCDLHGGEQVCQIVVTECEWPGPTVATGSLWFEWDSAAGKLEWRRTEGFPRNMSLTVDDVSSFTLRLNSAE